MKRLHIMSLAFAGFIALALTAVSTGPAQAQRGIKSGYCPANTCAKNGGPRAANLKNCSAANCKGDGLTKMPTKSPKKN